MANPTGAFGLRPVRHFNGAPWNGQTVPCYCEDSYATAMFIGDPVLITAATAERDPTLRYPTINVSDAVDEDIILGAIVAFDPYPDNLQLTYRPASTTRIAHVVMGADVVFECRGNAGATPDKNIIWNNAGLIATAGGSTVTGLSGFHLDEGTTTTPAANQSFPLLIIGISSAPDNEVGTSAIYEVILNTYNNIVGDKLGVVGA
jgi:hypothetical protein